MPIIAGAVRHSYDADPVLVHGIETSWLPTEKTLQAGEVVAALARVLMAGEHLAGFVNQVELPIRRERIVVLSWDFPFGFLPEVYAGGFGDFLSTSLLFKMFCLSCSVIGCSLGLQVPFGRLDTDHLRGVWPPTL